LELGGGGQGYTKSQELGARSARALGHWHQPLAASGQLLAQPQLDPQPHFPKTQEAKSAKRAKAAADARRCVFAPHGARPVGCGLWLCVARLAMRHEAAIRNIFDTQAAGRGYFFAPSASWPMPVACGFWVWVVALLWLCLAWLVLRRWPNKNTTTQTGLMAFY
jgi:hypothetical protein